MKSNTEYSTDPQTVVITMDVSGGFRVPTPPGFERQPWLQVFGDGRIVCGSQVPNRPTNTGRLTPAELQQLTNWLVQEQQLLELTAEKISGELEGYQSPIADAPTTTIKIQLAKVSREFSVYALKQTARDLPDAKGLQILATIEARLRKVRQLGDIGSQEILDSALQAANQHLEQELPDANPWTTDHLRSIERQPGGGLTLAFSRAKSISGDGYTLSLKLSRTSADRPWKIEFESK
ncbi:MAG: hypothetical protein JNL67_06055 [Planctomycetaceae bacterium]|nr:hypothetical protein [Planctomycetaceae bacterium]